MKSRNFMRGPIIAMFLMCFLASCHKPAHIEMFLTLRHTFERTPAQFDKLREMIQSDIGNQNCLVIGRENIGDYWQFNYVWQSPMSRTGIALPEVLRRTSISNDRYAEYRRLLWETGTQQVRACKSGGPLGDAEVIFSLNLSQIEDCSGNIGWYEKGPEPEKPELTPREHCETKGLSSIGYAPIGDDKHWYAEFGCRKNS
jgi:hypothetical protein